MKTPTKVGLIAVGATLLGEQINDRFLVKYGPNDNVGVVTAKPNMLGPQTATLVVTVGLLAFAGAKLWSRR